MPTRKVGGFYGDDLRGLRRTQFNDIIERRASVAIGASGAATVTGTGITCVKNTTGVYDVTFPAMAATSGVPFTLRVWIVQSAAVTVANAVIKAVSFTAGTAQFTTSLNTAGTPVEPASGDILAIEVVGADLNDG